MTEDTSSSVAPTDPLKPPLAPAQPPAKPAPAKAAPPPESKVTSEPSKLPPPPKTPPSGSAPASPKASGSNPGFTLSDVAREAESDLISELEGLKARLHELELALASLAGPSLSQDAHDGLGFLIKWWKNFEGRFAAARKARGISGGGA